MADPGSLPLQVRLHHVDVRVPLLPHQRGRYVRHLQLFSHRCKFKGIMSLDEYYFEGFLLRNPAYLVRPPFFHVPGRLPRPIPIKGFARPRLTPFGRGNSRETWDCVFQGCGGWVISVRKGRLLTPTTVHPYFFPPPIHGTSHVFTYITRPPPAPPTHHDPGTTGGQLFLSQENPSSPLHIK